MNVKRKNVVVMGSVALVLGIAGIVLKISKRCVKNKWCKLACKGA